MMNGPVLEEDESDELALRLSSLRQTSVTAHNVDDVVFGNIALTVKDAKEFKLQGLTVSLRVAYPKVYQTAIPVQETSKPQGHTFQLQNVTTEGTLVLEFFKGLITIKALNKINKALGKRVGVVKIPVNQLAEGEHTQWRPVRIEREATDFGVPQIQTTIRFEKKTSVTIEDFELLKLLGRGKFGKVFMCTQKATGKVYAIKMIRKQDLNSNAVDIHHTLVERLILSSVEHPFICNLKFAFQDQEKVYFVLQYIEGGELMYHVHSQGKPLDMARVIFYAAELVLALDYLHSRNVIYRDLKPENILIDREGNVRLTDFGLSKICKEKTHSICVPEDHEILTNQGFMDLRTWQQRSRADPTLLVAGFDQTAQQTVFERPLREIVMPAEQRTLVEFSNEAAGVSYLATTEHQVFVQRGSFASDGAFVGASAAPCKVSAGDFILGESKNPSFDGARHVAHAAHGVRASGSAGKDRSWARGLNGVLQRSAFLECYGFWIASTARVDHEGIVGARSLRFNGDAEQMCWLQQTLSLTGLARQDWGVECGGEAIVVSSPQWVSVFHGSDTRSGALASWPLACCDQDELWSIVCGVCRGAGSSARPTSGFSIVVRSPALAEQLVQLLVLAGLSASCGRLPSGECEVRVFDTTSPDLAKPMLDRRKGDIRAQPYNGRVWCLTMPSGLFWVRRVTRDESGAVLKASRPVVTGNCGTPQFLAPEMILYAKTVGYNWMVDWWALGIVIHEMASCMLPFDDENHQQLYRKIVYDKPVFPAYFTQELSSLLEGLLTKDPSQRLGQQVEDIKSHPFFASINWTKLEAKEIEPPFIPKLKKPTDTQYFYKAFTQADTKDSVALISVADETQERFRNFSFTNLNELHGNTTLLGADGGENGGENSNNGTVEGGLNIKMDDELTRTLNPLAKKAPAKQPDFVMMHKNPLQQLAQSTPKLPLSQRVGKLFAKEGIECPAPPTQLSVHPWPHLMTEASEHSSWGNVMSDSSHAQDWWGSAAEPSRVICIGRAVMGWQEDPGIRCGDMKLSYALVDQTRKRVCIWHGPESAAALRGRATRVALMWGQELELPVVMCPANALVPKPELHNPSSTSFPRSLEEARESQPGSEVLLLSDGRRAYWLWCSSKALPPEMDEKIRECPQTPSIEREGDESVVFRAHFRLLWGPDGDVPLRRAVAKRRFVARRSHEASCALGDKLWILGEGQVPHWCYIQNRTTGARGLTPIEVLSEDSAFSATTSPRDDMAGGGISPIPAEVPQPVQRESPSLEKSLSASGKISRMGKRVISSTNLHADHSPTTQRNEGNDDGSGQTSPRDKDTPRTGKLKSALSTVRNSRGKKDSGSSGGGGSGGGKRKGSDKDVPPTQQASFPGIRLRVVEGGATGSGSTSGSLSPTAQQLAQKAGGATAATSASSPATAASVAFASSPAAVSPASPSSGALAMQQAAQAQQLGDDLLNLDTSSTYICPQCEKQFSQRNQLLDHLHASARSGGVCPGQTRRLSSSSSVEKKIEEDISYSEDFEEEESDVVLGNN